MRKRNDNPSRDCGDNRITWENRQITDPDTGAHWRIDAKVNLASGVAKVYRVHGDVTNREGFERALDLELAALSLAALSPAARAKEREDDESDTDNRS